MSDFAQSNEAKYVPLEVLSSVFFYSSLHLLAAFRLEIYRVQGSFGNQEHFQNTIQGPLR